MTAGRARARAIAIAALLLPGAAAAQPVLGLRLAWAPAFGSAAAHVPVSEAVEWQLPIQADALWAFSSFAAGAYASFGPGRVGTQACVDGASCSAQVLRAGAQGLLGFAPWSFGAAPWVGLGIGWEWASQRRERLGATTTTRWSGPELALQAGAAWGLGRGFALGPFVLGGFGRYTSQDVDTGAASASASLPDRAVHGWLHLGVRGTYAF